MDEGDRLKDDLSQCGCDMCDQDKEHERHQTACTCAHSSVLRMVALCILVLVGVRRVTVVIVHIGHEGVLVVIWFYVAIFVVIFSIRRCTLYTPRR